MLTFQDFERGGVALIPQIVTEHQKCDLYTTALTANEYDHQKNTTIYNYAQMLFTLTGAAVVDYTATNNRIASNFFNRLNTQRNTYLLGNGVTFGDDTDRLKKALGSKFDTDMKRCAYKALIHGLAFGFWDYNKLYTFPVTEFAPLWDEDTGALRAGLRFWRIDPNKPVTVYLYEEDGFTVFRGKDYGSVVLAQEKRGYKQLVRANKADGAIVAGYENYGALPIVPFWGSELHQSTLVGMRNAIDSFDLIQSGFANDLSDCTQVYWILENYNGMTDSDIKRMRDRMKFNHIVSADTMSGGSIKPYTVEIPFEARKTYLEHIRDRIYEDFGALDVHTVAAGDTNDHIDAAYQPLDEEADDFEFQCIEFIQQVCKLAGFDDVKPTFKRNRISNQTEQTEMILSASEWLDTETILKKLPFVTVDEVAKIMKNLDARALTGLSSMEALEEAIKALNKAGDQA